MKVARLWTIRVKEGDEREFLKALKEISLPFLRTRIGKGFLGLYLLRNQKVRNEITYLTIWESRKALERNLASREWTNALKRFGARGFQMGEPQIVHCDIMASLGPE